ncbi:MAG: lysophospholipid acyltransferase family protein [Congregibacter sp.]
MSLKQGWRITAAAISYVMFGLGGLLPGVYAIVLSLAPMDAARKQKKLRSVIGGLCRFYLWAMRLLGLIAYSIEGMPTGKLRGHVVIANHSMLIDALFVLGYVDDVCCVVKASLARNPFTRVPVRLAGYIENDDPRLLDVARQKLSLGENILIFPEGTRNSSDLELTFKRGAANLAIISEAPILPVLLLCVPRALGKDQSWYQLPPQRLRVSMRFLPEVRVPEVIDISLPRPLQYRFLTRYLRELYHSAISHVQRG